MKKNIIITAGPTNERIDAVMKITNMSTGALGAVMADTLLSKHYNDINTIYYISPKMAYKPRSTSGKIEFVTVDSTNDLLNVLKKIFASAKIDIIIHSSAVGDYAGKYVVRAEDLIDEIYDAIQNSHDKAALSREALMSIFENPRAVCNDETKISSYEPHLMTMLKLTPKVISQIKKMAPDVTLVCFKLLEGVSKKELFDVANRLREKNHADFIVANDLSKIGGGKHWAMILGENGIITECHTKQEIADSLCKLLF